MSDPGNRDYTGRFAPGVSGNPNGRPKASRELAELIRKRCPEVVERLFEIALNPKGGLVAVRASEVLLERGYGKAPVTMEDSEGNPLRIGVVVLPGESNE